MPNTSVTPCATSVSTNASEGVMRVRPETTMRFTSAILVMEGSRKNEKAVQSLTSRVLENDNLAKCRARDRKSTRLNSSHSQISYAVFCLKKKKKKKKKNNKQNI